MTDDDKPSLELKLARAAYAAAEELKKTAEQDRSAAAYDLGQIDWRLREIQSLEKIISAREKKLGELNEPALLERERIADAKLAEAQELMRAYDRDKHAAAISLNQINAREQAKREAAA